MTNAGLPGFTREASRAWMGVPAEARENILANVYCGHCRGAVSIVNLTGQINRGDLLLKGNCATCGHAVARLVVRS